MKYRSLKNIAAVAAFAVLPADAQAQADPEIVFTFPDHVHLGGGARHKRVSGSFLEKVYNSNGKIERLKLTCRFAEALDPNNQKFCDTPEHRPGVYKAMRHYATSHHTCRQTFGQIETAARQHAGDRDIVQKVNQLARPGWESSPYCPLLDARDQLMGKYRAMGLTVN